MVDYLVHSIVEFIICVLKLASIFESSNSESGKDFLYGLFGLGINFWNYILMCRNMGGKDWKKRINFVFFVIRFLGYITFLLVFANGLTLFRQLLTVNYAIGCVMWIWM